jgi:hypothetical protein
MCLQVKVSDTSVRLVLVHRNDRIKFIKFVRIDLFRILSQQQFRVKLKLKFRVRVIDHIQGPFYGQDSGNKLRAKIRITFKAMIQGLYLG